MVSVTTNVMQLPTDIPPFNHSFVFEFEKGFDLKAQTDWLHEKLFIPIVLGLLYVGILLNGPDLMKNRKPFDLRIPLTLWNGLFAVVSVCGTYRMMPELFRAVREFGFYHSVCNIRGFVDDPIIGFWLWTMVYCKVGQLIDTIFIVLRKKEVTFLHGYHHFTDLYAAAYSSLEIPSQSRWFVSINYFVHAVMNTYFAFRTMQVKMPNYYPKVVTALQVLQMAIAVYVSWFTNDVMKKGYECHISKHTAKLILAWYTVSLVLFSAFYYYRYIAPSTPPKSSSNVREKSS